MDPQEEPFEAMLTRAHGEALPIEVRARRTDRALVVSFRDARELLAGREAVSQLFEAEARYRGLVEQVPAVVYEDRGHTTIYVSPQIEDILGVTPQAYMQDAGMWLRMVHPDDREWVRTQSEAFLAGEGGDLDDYRMVRPDGRIVWVRDRAFAYRDDAGRVILEQGPLFDVTELKEAEARVTHMAYHDALTGLANRELFHESLLLAVERARRDRTSIAVLYLDLDNFKHLNDTMGHHAGDLLLAGLAARLQRSTRDVDLVARRNYRLGVMNGVQPSWTASSPRASSRPLRQPPRRLEPARRPPPRHSLRRLVPTQIFIAPRIQGLPYVMFWYRRTAISRITCMLLLTVATFTLGTTPALLLLAFFALYAALFPIRRHIGPSLARNGQQNDTPQAARHTSLASAASGAASCHARVGLLAALLPERLYRPKIPLQLRRALRRRHNTRKHRLRLLDVHPRTQSHRSRPAYHPPSPLQARHTVGAHRA